MPRPKIELILLSVFDGIGCAMLAIDQLKEQFDLTVHFFAWETDQECIDVTARRFNVRHRGDFRTDDMDELVQQIHDIDAQGTMLILLTAGPPCADYSQILGDAGMGKLGNEGIKFEQFCSWQDDLQRKVAPRTVA